MLWMIIKIALVFTVMVFIGYCIDKYGKTENEEEPTETEETLTENTEEEKEE